MPRAVIRLLSEGDRGFGPLQAAVLRKYLIQHAEQVGCPCGSDEWLADTLLEANLHDEEKET